MTPEIKERLYRELMHMLVLLEEGNIRETKIELEDLINKIQYNQI
jgi:hypothetical protein